MSVDLIRDEKDPRVAVITLNRPRAFNSLDGETSAGLRTCLIEFRDDPGLWVAVLTGAGRHAFSIGADIHETLPAFKEQQDNPDVLSGTPMRGLELNKPLIGAVNGMALGGGLELALTCDIRVASDKARFGFPEVGLGIIPGWGGTQRLPRQIPWCLAAELLFTGKIIDAAEAFRIGLVNKVVPYEEVLPAALEIAREIAGKAPLAVRAAKEAMLRGSGMPLEKGLEIEADLEMKLVASADFEEGLKAHAERRKPEYKGR